MLLDQSRIHVLHSTCFVTCCKPIIITLISFEVLFLLIEISYPSCLDSFLNLKNILQKKKKKTFITVWLDISQIIENSSSNSDFLK